jgi:hypothetical protein
MAQRMGFRALRSEIRHVRDAVLCRPSLRHDEKAHHLARQYRIRPIRRDVDRHMVDLLGLLDVAEQRRVKRSHLLPHYREDNVVGG